MTPLQQRQSLQESYKLKSQMTRLTTPAMNQTLNFFLGIRGEESSVQAKLTRAFITMQMAQYASPVHDLTLSSYITQRGIQGLTSTYTPVSQTAPTSLLQALTGTTQGNVMYFLGSHFNNPTAMPYNTVISGARQELQKGIFDIGREVTMQESSEDRQKPQIQRVVAGGGCDFCKLMAVKAGSEDASFHGGCKCVLTPVFGDSKPKEPWEEDFEKRYDEATAKLYTEAKAQRDAWTEANPRARKVPASVWKDSALNNENIMRTLRQTA